MSGPQPCKSLLFHLCCVLFCLLRICKDTFVPRKHNFDIPIPSLSLLANSGSHIHSAICVSLSCLCTTGRGRGLLWWPIIRASTFRKDVRYTTLSHRLPYRFACACVCALVSLFSSFCRCVPFSLLLPLSVFLLLRLSSLSIGASHSFFLAFWLFLSISLCDNLALVLAISLSLCLIFHSKQG